VDVQESDRCHRELMEVKQPLQLDAPGS